MGNKKTSTTDEWANGISKDLCECCRNQKWKLSLDKKYSKEKIFVCEEFFKNIENKNLLPLEWYHLAVIHGLSYDDEEFYREDGTSKSKKFKREINTSTGLPNIQSLGNDLDGLIEYSLFPYADKENYCQALSQFSKKTILRRLIELYQIKPTLNIWEHACDICTLVLKDSAENWIRCQ